VSREEWLARRTAFLAKERAMTTNSHALGAVGCLGQVAKAYVLKGPQGECTLADLFRGRSQLAVYPSCWRRVRLHLQRVLLTADHIDAARQHFEHADLSFAAISRAALRTDRASQTAWAGPSLGLLARHRLQLRFWSVVQKEDLAAGRAIYNYGTPIEASEDMFGTSILPETRAATSSTPTRPTTVGPSY